MSLANPFCPGPLSRRNFLKVGSLTIGALGFNGLLPLKITASESLSRDDTAVILIWLPGGPPHMETVGKEAGRAGGVPRRFPADPDQRPRHRRVRTPADARQDRESVHADPVGRSRVCRSRRRAQEIPHRPRSAIAGWIRQRL